MSVRDAYLAVHRQGWIPIFPRDGFDALFLADACAEAGASVIEVTCRRPAVVDEIKRIKGRHPSLRILVGSTVDFDEMVRFNRQRGGHLPTLDELADLGVDGFVSQLPLRLETIVKYRDSHVLMPGVETGTEAYRVVADGAHFAKIYAASLFGGPDYIRAITAAPTHGLLPIFVTGGVSREKIRGYLGARAISLGAGWDLMLGERHKPLQEAPVLSELVETLSAYMREFDSARREFYPALTEALSGSDEAYLRAIPHYHPFANESK